MGILELFITAVALSMDAFAVAMCKGLATPKLKIKHMLLAGLWFGGFQALMPLIGYFLGNSFADFVTSVDHWIAFGLLVLIGLNMIRETIWGDDEKQNNDFGFRTMLIMAVATSIDALTIGITMAFMHVNIWIAATAIGIITFILSAIGVKLGCFFGEKFSSKAGILGGAILIGMGIKILLEHI
jgi:putative Mn2+ efflux pump MntP